MTSNFESIMKAKMAEAAQDFLSQLLSQKVTGQELLSALQSTELAPYLDQVTVSAANSVASPSRLKVAPNFPAKRGRKPKAAKVAKAARKASRPAGVRTYTSFSTEQRAEMKQLIQSMVAAKPGEVTTPEVVTAVVAKYPPIRDHAVLGLIRDLIKERQIKAISGRPLKYQPGKSAS